MICFDFIITAVAAGIAAATAIATSFASWLSSVAKMMRCRSAAACASAAASRIPRSERSRRLAKADWSYWTHLSVQRSSIRCSFAREGLPAAHWCSSWLDYGLFRRRVRDLAAAASGLMLHSCFRPDC